MANTRSRDRNRESRGQNVASCILVSVVFCIAAWASPLAHVEGQVLGRPSTIEPSHVALGIVRVVAAIRVPPDRLDRIVILIVNKCYLVLSKLYRLHESISVQLLA
jgi:hypothetical protein